MIAVQRNDDVSADLHDVVHQGTRHEYYTVFLKKFTTVTFMITVRNENQIVLGRNVADEICTTVTFMITL